MLSASFCNENCHACMAVYGVSLRKNRVNFQGKVVRPAGVRAEDPVCLEKGATPLSTLDGGSFPSSKRAPRSVLFSEARATVLLLTSYAFSDRGPLSGSCLPVAAPCA